MRHLVSCLRYHPDPLAQLSVYVELRMRDEDSGLALMTVASFTESTTHPSPTLRETLARISESHTSLTRSGDTWTTTEYLSRSHPAAFIKHVIDAHRPEDAESILRDVEEGGIMRDVEQGMMTALHNLMTFRSLQGLTRGKGRDTSLSVLLMIVMEDAPTIGDRIAFWAGAAVMHQLWEINTCLDLTTDDLTSLDQAIDYLADHPPTSSSPAHHEPHLDHPPDHQLLRSPQGRDT